MLATLEFLENRELTLDEVQDERAQGVCRLVAHIVGGLKSLSLDARQLDDQLSSSRLEHQQPGGAFDGAKSGRG